MLFVVKFSSKTELLAFICAVLENYVYSLRQRLTSHGDNMKKITSDKWDRPYTRTQAAYPLKDQIKNKFWPAVSRIDNAFGDRNLVCSCMPLSELVDS